MNSLPSEILHLIFIQLSFKGRLDCTLVCRHWYNNLAKHSLLYDIEITSDRNLISFVNMLQQLPSRASQVEILTLHAGCAFDKRKLCNMLTNLRVFRNLSNPSEGRPQTHCNASFQLIMPHSNLEMMTDDTDCELTRQLLQFGSCHRLRTLNISLKYIKDPRTEIFVHLKSAPALKELTLSSCESDIGIEDLEIIHTNVPLLRKLSLIVAVIVSGALPTHIIPATTVKEFKMKSVTVKYSHDRRSWYNYLGQKYTNLAHFESGDQWMDNLYASRVTELYESGMLTVYKNNNIPLPFLKVVDIPTELQFFNRLDQFGLRVSKLEIEDHEDRPIFDQLAESNQPRHIKNLMIDNTPITSPMMFQHFTSLVTLHIDSKNKNDIWDVDLADYFDAFPATLTQFHACFRDAKISRLPSHSNNVHNLFLECHTIYPELGEALSNCFPKLKTLGLQGLVTESLGIDLSHHSLKRLSFQAEFDKVGSHSFTVVETSKASLKHYMLKGPSTICLESATAEEIQDLVNIHIKCAKATSIKLYSTDVGKIAC